MNAIPSFSGYRKIRVFKFRHTLVHLLFDPWAAVDDQSKLRRVRLLSGFLFCYSIYTFLGSGATWSREAGLGLILLSDAFSLMAVYFISRTRYFTLAKVLTMIVAALPVFLQIVNTGGVGDPAETMMWIVLPIIISSLVASVRFTIIVSLIYMATLTTLIPIAGLPSIYIASMLSFILSVSLLVIAISSIRTIDQRQAEYQLVRRLETQKRMDEREEFFRMLLDSFTMGAFVVHPETNCITDMNAAAARMIGLEREDIIGQVFKSFFEYESTERDDSGAGQDLTEGTLVTSDGKTVPVLINSVSFRSQAREVRFKSVMDISERKAAEEREKKLEQELMLNSRLASLGQMAAGVAHEINNPLASIIGYTSLLVESDIEEKHKEDIEIIAAQAERVAKIVTGMLSFSNPNRANREPVNVNEVLKATVDFRGYEMKTSNIYVTFRLAPDLPRIAADQSQLQQVFFNIITNAEKEMFKAHGGGQLTLSTENTGDRIRVMIADDGPGIRGEIIGHIFDPFFSTNQVGEGTGLGLSICHSIVSAHHGRIDVESEPDKGTTFTIELPLGVMGYDHSTRITDEKDDVGSRIAHARILVVDDEPPILLMMERMLSGDGCMVQTVESASGGLDLIQSQPFDVILLDVKMPGSSGIDLYRVLEKENPSVIPKIVFVTGNAMDEETNAFFREKQASYITKPVNISQLKSNIVRILENGPS